jgi:hypothetical protein
MPFAKPIVGRKNSSPTRDGPSNGLVKSGRPLIKGYFSASRSWVRSCLRPLRGELNPPLQRSCWRASAANSSDAPYAGIDFWIRPSEVVCIIGPSGSGKSTPLRCMAFREEYTAGEVEIEGNCSASAELRRGFARDSERGVDAVRRKCRHGVPALQFMAPHDPAECRARASLDEADASASAAEEGRPIDNGEWEERRRRYDYI